MSETILNVISVLVTSVIVPLIAYLGAKLGAYLKEKTNNDKLQAYVENAVKAVNLAVMETTQTYVDTLKKTGEFNAEAQKEAFNKSLERAKELITEDAKKAVIAVYGDFGAWLEAQLETQVKENKGA